MSVADDQAANQNNQNMEQVRELLFGEMRREQDNRLEALDKRIRKVEERLLDRVSELETEIAKLSTATSQSQDELVSGLSDVVSKLPNDIKGLAGS